MSNTPEIEVIDMFDHIELLPNDVAIILHRYYTGDNTYENCQNLVSELEAIGWTCSYGLDAEPYELHKIN